MLKAFYFLGFFYKKDNLRFVKVKYENSLSL